MEAGLSSVAHPCIITTSIHPVSIQIEEYRKDSNKGNASYETISEYDYSASHALSQLEQSIAVMSSK